MRKFIALIFCCILLCTTADATITIKDDVLTASGVALVTTVSSYPDTASTDRGSCYYNESNPNYFYPHRFNFGLNHGWIYLEPCITTGSTTLKLGTIQVGTISRQTASYSNLAGATQTCGFKYSNGAICRAEGSATMSSGSASVTRFNVRGGISKVVLKNCSVAFSESSYGYTVYSRSMTGTCIIDGGNYKGYPAINSGSITINKGTLTDYSSTNSTFIVGPESEQTTSQSGGGLGTTGSTTIITVKLSNPPVIIDWADFPG